ncbi:trigger factor [Tundrisphaera lichenicola]|uniref:trigger factor n=1 Tax=Tundrisphaera lichenicola TaxID=2029860 RepID=UPI003EC13376
MSTGEDLETPSTSEDASTAVETKVKLDLDVQISDVGPCKKHVKVTIPRSDVEKQFKESVGEMAKEAVVPGFRPGHAPRQLVEKRFRKQVAGQVKSVLLMASLEQIDEDHKLNPISQPDLDVEAIELPEDGPMTFEMDVEVRPDFPLPAYKALTIKSPVREITDGDIDVQVKAFRERYAQLIPKLEGGAEIGDFVTANLTFRKDGVVYNEAKEIQFRLQTELRFQDGTVPGLDAVLVGVKPEESREAEAKIGSSSADPNLRGQSMQVTFEVLDLKHLRLPELDSAFFAMTGFDDLEDLRTALKGVLERRREYARRQAVRDEILTKLISETPFDLPADLVAKQEKATLRRLALDLRQGGLNDTEIRAREAELRANAHEETLRSLKEFFVLAKIAEAEDIKVEDEDMEVEIEAIAARTDESPRRVRARVEKEGLADALASQILERKSIDRILEFVKLEEVPLVDDKVVETLDQAATTAPEGLPEEPSTVSGESA